MQSGYGNTRRWVLEFEPDAARGIDDLMGWTSSSDTSEQVLLQFGTCEAAVAFAETHDLAYTVQVPHVQKMRRRTYADNFRYGKVS